MASFYNHQIFNKKNLNKKLRKKAIVSKRFQPQLLTIEQYDVL